MGNGLELQCDATLGRDFWEAKGATISYCNHEVIIGNTVIKFDPAYNETEMKIDKLTLKARSENLVKLHTPSKGIGLISKQEISPGIYLAESLTREINGLCVISVINTLEEDVTIESPHVQLEERESTDESAFLIFSSTIVEDESRLSKFRHDLRTDHLNSEERVSLVKICEEYNDVFHLPGDKLTCTTAAVHAIPTPTIDPNRSINTRLYKIPEVHKEEVQRQTEQMLSDGIIAPSTSLWNSAILEVPKKPDASGKRKWRIVVDFRKLNDITVGDSFPIPVISEVLDALGNSKYSFHY
jgi:hypothetical protein